MTRTPRLISVLCPTRNRPGNVQRLLESVAATSRGGVEVVFRTDDDAPLDCDPWGVTEVRGPRITLSQMWNEAYSASNGEIVMQCADDIVFRTSGWDERVRSTFDQIPDRIGLVWGNDGFQGGNLATHGFVHHRWADALGYVTPPYFSWEYSDKWLHDLATAVGRHYYLADVMTEHMHYAAGKAVMDQTYSEGLARAKRDHVMETWNATVAERERDVVKLRAVMGVSDALG